MVSVAAVQEKRNELLSLRSEVGCVQSTYMEQANRRVALQKKLANILQYLQDKSLDRLLVEDTIIVSLQTETAVKQIGIEVPEKPIIPDASSQPQGKTSSAEEAMAVYTDQIETLNKEFAYRNAMKELETSMATIYEDGLNRLMGVVDDYCTENHLKSRLEALAQ